MKIFVKVMISLVWFLCSMPGQGAETILQCSVNKLGPYKGVRVNVIKSGGKLKARLFQGTTIHGDTYWVEKTSKGYTGADRTGKYVFEMTVSRKAAKNAYIEGVEARLVNATYPMVRNQRGWSSIDTSRADRFVCGKKINDFSN